VAPAAEKATAEERRAPDGQADDNPGARSAAANDNPREPPGEQELALEQWLRQVPDDPAGLLRRKFMLEHLRRQQRPSP
jgi:Ca-activated chloride channel family protein